MTVDKKKTKDNSKDGQTFSTAPWCGHRHMQCDRIEGVPGVLRNKVKKKEKYPREQGGKNLF